MSLTLTAEMIDKLAARISEASGLDIEASAGQVAECLGLADATALRAAASSAPVTMVIAFGHVASRDVPNREKLDEDGMLGLVEREFPDQSHAQAYVDGLFEMNGWSDYAIVARSGDAGCPAITPEFFEARKADPAIMFGDWHNARIDEDDPEADEEDDIAPSS